MIDITTIIAGIIGLLVGCLVTAMVTLEHEFFMLHCIRLPYRLHRQLKAEARQEHKTIRALIIARLQGEGGR